MKQSKIDSLMETLVNIVIGMTIASFTNALILPAVTGVHITGHQNLMISSAFTVVSLVRQFTLRRLFNGRSPWAALKGLFNAQETVRVAEAPLDRDPRFTASGIPRVRRNADQPSQHRKRSYHFWGIRK